MNGVYNIAGRAAQQIYARPAGESFERCVATAVMADGTTMPVEDCYHRQVGRHLSNSQVARLDVLSRVLARPPLSIFRARPTRGLVDSRRPHDVPRAVTRRESHGQPARANAPPDDDPPPEPPSKPRTGRPPVRLEFGVRLALQALEAAPGTSRRSIDRALNQAGICESTRKRVFRRLRALGVIDFTRGRRQFLWLGQPLTTHGVVTWPVAGESPDEHAARHRERVIDRSAVAA
jgi:hypothetical protein